MVKLDIYGCDRCPENIEIEDGLKPITVTHVDGRYSNAEVETLHLCDDCYMVFLIAMSSKKKVRKKWDKFAEKIHLEELE